MTTAGVIPLEGKPPTNAKRPKWVGWFFLIVIGGVIWAAIIDSGSRQESLRPTTQRLTHPRSESTKQLVAHLLVTITKDEYSYGYLKIVGTVKNTGDGDAFSPSVIVEVYDPSETTLLAQDHAWPAGQYLSHMEPGVSAAFQSMASVPGEPARIIYRVRVEQYPFTVEMPKR